MSNILNIMEILRVTAKDRSWPAGQIDLVIPDAVHRVEALEDRTAKGVIEALAVIMDNHERLMVNRGLYAKPPAPVPADEKSARKAKHQELVELGVDFEAMLAKRSAARNAKDFALADSIRDGLLKIGVRVIDMPGGSQRWEPCDAAS